MIGERRDRLDIVGRQFAEEAVHHLAPGPEAVMRRASFLGEAGHAALERVAVQVRHAGDREARNVLRAAARRIRRDARDRAAGHVDAHIARPAGIQQRMIEMIRGHAATHARLGLSAQGGAVMRQHERHARRRGPGTRRRSPEDAREQFVGHGEKRERHPGPNKTACRTSRRFPPMI
jgi:hypothetical protein